MDLVAGKGWAAEELMSTMDRVVDVGAVVLLLARCCKIISHLSIGQGVADCRTSLRETAATNFGNLGEIANNLSALPTVMDFTSKSLGSNTG